MGEGGSSLDIPAKRRDLAHCWRACASAAVSRERGVQASPHGGLFCPRRPPGRLKSPFGEHAALAALLHGGARTHGGPPSIIASRKLLPGGQWNMLPDPIQIPLAWAPSPLRTQGRSRRSSPPLPRGLTGGDSSLTPCLLPSAFCLLPSLFCLMSAGLCPVAYVRRRGLARILGGSCTAR